MAQEKHRTREEIQKKLSPFESIEENQRCPECNGILITNFGAGISCTYCADCDYQDYDYDL